MILLLRPLAIALRCILVLVALCAPALVMAQGPIEDVDPPVITMPLTGGYQTASAVINIQFSDYSFDPSSMVETVNGVSFTSAFTFALGPLCPPKTTCLRTASASGTIHLNPGSNTFHVELCDNDGNCGAKDAHYTYTPPPPYQLLSVTPSYESVEAERSFSYVQMFHIYNGGDSSTTYTLTRTCSSSLIASGCTPATATRTIAGGQSDTASISYVSTAAAGATGQLKLAVVSNSDPTVHDSGTVDVHVIPLNTPGVVAANLNPGETVERGLCLTVSVHSGAYECGDLRLDYEFPHVHTMEKDRAPTLIYNNEFAHPIERVAAEITLPNDGRHPDSVTAKLLVTRAGSPVQVDAEKWLGADWSLGSVRRVVLSYDAITDSTGLYQYSIQINKYYGLTIESNTVASDLVVVNRSTSPFGAGWWVAGLERLIPLGSSKWLWIGGDGSTRVFSPSGTNLWLAANVDRRERLEWDGTYYCRRLVHHACVLFNTQGQHVQTRNRLGEVLATLDRTNFTYNGNLLTSIGLPVPSGALTYTFAYDTVSGKPRFLRLTAPPVGSVTRITTATITGGQLLSLQYNAHPAVQFAYDGTLSNRILSVTNQKGYVERYAFGALNTLATAKLGLSSAATDTIAYTFSPVEIKGVAGTGLHAVTHQSAYTKYDGPRTDVGDSTLFWLDRFGAPAKIRDAIGNETVLTRADPNYPSLVTQMRLPNGRTSTATYDSVGHVLTSTAINPLGTGVNAITTYTWNMKFDFIATTTSPTGLLTTFGYDTLTGNRIWQYPGTDPVRKVLFQYGNTLMQLSSTQLPGYTAKDSVTYGTLGNVVVTRSPIGFVDSVYANGIGQDTLTVSQTGMTPADTAHVRARTAYDDRGLDTLSVSNAQNLETQTVRTHHDENGNADSVKTTMTPDLKPIGLSYHAYVFDAADRRVTENLPWNEHHTWVYDLAGNQTNGGARGGNNVSNSYNALNQLIARSASDIATFTYDEVGEMVTADNSAARISRSYYLGGALKADTLRIATTALADQDFTQHIYGLNYGYDLEGRRAWMTVGSDSTAYSYETITGQLALIRDPAANLFRFGYDTVGRMTQRTMLSGAADSLYERNGYDAESHRTALTGTMGTGTAAYDGRGKMYSTDAAVTYSPMGVLTASNSGTVIEAYEADPLGNIYRTDVSGPDLPTTQPKYSIYSDSTAQLIQDYTRDGAFTDTTNYVFNPQTGVLISSDHLKNVDTIPGQHRYEHRTNRNFYDNAAQLDSTSFLVDTMPYSLGHLSTDYHAAEYYRYDALNRRVWMRNVRDANCIHQDRSSGCRSNERRTVWDGDQILYEIQVKGDSASTVLDNDSYALAPFYGTVRYTHGIGIDAPLALYKGNQTVIPMRTFTGKYFEGMCRPAANCVTYSIYWPEGSGSTYRMHGTQADGPPSWYGSLIESQQDASGLQYKRNRYYDPQSGRFTQEDPIGLAGGLNSYGFANGDPVNFADPFGLCPICLVVAGAALEGAVEGAAIGAGEQYVLNKLRGRPALENMGGAIAIGAGVGAVTAGVGSAVRMLRAVGMAADATGYAETTVASRAEAEAAGETHVGSDRVEMVDRQTGDVKGVRNPKTGARYRPEVGQDHVNLENAKGGNTHVLFPQQ